MKIRFDHRRSLDRDRVSFFPSYSGFVSLNSYLNSDGSQARGCSSKFINGSRTGSVRDPKIRTQVKYAVLESSAGVRVRACERVSRHREAILSMVVQMRVCVLDEGAALCLNSVGIAAVPGSEQQGRTFTGAWEHT